MNWTGGNLQRHRRGGKSASVQRQKAHFAKMRARTQCQPASDYESTIIPPTFRYDQHHDGDTEEDQCASRDRRRSKSAQQDQSVIGSASPVHASDDDESLPQLDQDARDGPREISPAVLTTIEEQRQALLDRADWSGLAATRRKHVSDLTRRRNLHRISGSPLAPRRRWKTHRPTTQHNSDFHNSRDDNIHKSARNRHEAPARGRKVRRYESERPGSPEEIIVHIGVDAIDQTGLSARHVSEYEQRHGQQLDSVSQSVYDDDADSLYAMPTPRPSLRRAQPPRKHDRMSKPSHDHDFDHVTPAMASPSNPIGPVEGYDTVDDHDREQPMLDRPAVWHDYIRPDEAPHVSAYSQRQSCATAVQDQVPIQPLTCLSSHNNETVHSGAGKQAVAASDTVDYETGCQSRHRDDDSVWRAFVFGSPGSGPEGRGEPFDAWHNNEDDDGASMRVMAHRSP